MKPKPGWITIQYEINDGYIGGARPQYLQVPESEWNEMGEDEREEYVREMVVNNLSIDWEIKP